MVVELELESRLEPVRVAAVADRLATAEQLAEILAAK